jgi:hypothetical protein
MMRNNIPSPNTAVAAILRSDTMRTLMAGKANQARAIYQSIVAKRTGRLAASAQASVTFGGRRNDRWVGRLTVGEGGAPYGVSHEFGTRHGNAAHDLNKVLNSLGEL